MILFKPGAQFAFAHPAHLIAFGFGAGLAPHAPGTFGTLLAWPVGAALIGAYPVPALLGAIAFFFAAGVWACGLTGRHLGVHDHGAMVWDEFVAFLLILVIVPPDLAWQAAAFVLFRFFDIVKPAPIRWLERRFKGGLGVMLDDVLAAGYALLCLALIKRVFF